MKNFIVCATYYGRMIGQVEVSDWEDTLHILDLGTDNLFGCFLFRRFDPPVTISFIYPTEDPGDGPLLSGYHVPKEMLVKYRETQLKRMSREVSLPKITSAKELEDVIRSRSLHLEKQ